jgi:F420H(2)-dependent quinone reductase
MRVRVTTTGARTGATRAVMLYAWEDGDDLVLVGSRGGAARDPGWAHNLRAHPTVEVTSGTRRWPATAEEVTDPVEYERIWALVVERFSAYASFARRTKRRIPLFRLVPG